MKPRIVHTRERYEAVRPYVAKTPVVVNDELNAELGAACFFKCENLQKTGSFKYRGAIHSLLRLDDASRRRGVVTVSSGNHGAALAKAGQVLDVRIHVIVSEQEVVLAMWALHAKLKMLIEPSSSTVFAALLKNRETFRGKRVGMILTGGNLDLEAFYGNR